MTEAIADEIQVAYIEEDNYGEQKTGSNLQNLRLTGESLAQMQTTITSAELRNDRQTTNVKRVGLSTSGDINGEFSFGTYEDFLKAALETDDDWTSQEENITAEITISCANADNSINDSASGLAAFDADQWIYVEGFAGANAVNNGYMKLVSVAAGKLVVEGKTLIDATAGDSVTITQLSSITNGTTLPSFNVERIYTDLSTNLALFLGAVIDTWNIAIVPEQIITTTFGTIGKIESSETSSGGSGYDAVNTNEIMNAVDEVQDILENLSGATLLDFNFTLTNNLRARMAIGTLGTVSVGKGKIGIEGSLQAYYESATLYNKFLNQTPSSIAVVIQDVDGNAYVIELMQLKFSEAGRPATGENTDIIVNMSFTSYMDPTEAKTVRISRFTAS